MSSKKKLLILSNGPVPVPEQPIVEGGGLRCWGLAKGIVANKSDDIEVTVAYEKSYRKKTFTQSFEGVSIKTWSIDMVADFMQSYDTILVSYCMGELSNVVAQNIRDDQQLVLDCYVPIYVEVSARESADVDREFDAFMVDVPKWAEVLRRGDVFLCANDAQKDFYKGVLAAVGRINPITYSEELLLVVPYGIYREEPKQTHKPITKLIGNEEKYLKILWFGGIYPWFDIRELADAVKLINKTTPAKLVVVGAKNPFNNHPDFNARYDEFVTHVKDKKLSDYVVMQEWIDFNDRANWYLDADIVVVFNKIGEENKLAWRTRLVDFMWADLPVITNGGDPLGEKMLENKAAIRIMDTDASSIANAVIKSVANPKDVHDLKSNMSKLKQAYYWDVVTGGLAKHIAAGKRAADQGRIQPTSQSDSLISSGNGGLLLRAAKKAKKMPAYAKKYGKKATVLAIVELVRRRLASGSIIKKRNQPAYVFVSHQLDNSGAPYVIMDMAIEFKDAGKPVEFYTYMPIAKENLAKLKKHHISPRVLMKKEMVPHISTGDTVVLNTVAHSEQTKEALFHEAEQDKIKLKWYLHEDYPETLFREDEKKRISKMLVADQMTILSAAKKMRENYINYFETKRGIKLLPYRHIVPAVFHQPHRPPVDYDSKLTFILPGTVGDGRKGQLPVFYAFVNFYNHYYIKNPGQYRDFELVYVGLDTDFLSKQLRTHATALKGHFKYYDKMAWTENLSIVAKGNVTICYSLSECLPLFVFEGMIAGHVLLRNDSSGSEEQLVDGENGFRLETGDFSQLVATIERVLNKKKTSSRKLASMGHKGYAIAKKQEKFSYIEGLESEK